MIGIPLKKYASEHGLKTDGGFAYGTLHGYRVALDDGPNIKRMFLFTRFPDETQQAAFDAMLNGSDAVTRYRIQTREYRDDRILFVFTDKMGTMTLIGEFIDWLLPQLPQLGMEADVCSHCGMQTSGSGIWAVIDGLPLYTHESCLRSKADAIRSGEERAKEELTGSYLRGFVGALLGGLLGALIWGAVMYFNIIAGIIGFLIGLFAEKGYNLLKGKQGKGKLAILIVVILLCVFIGTMFGEYIACVKAMHEEGITQISSLEMFRLILQQSDVRSAILKDFLLGLLFAGLGVFGLLARTRRETADTSIKILK